MVFSACIVDFQVLLNWNASEFGEEWLLIGHPRLLRLRFACRQMVSYRQ